MESPKPEAESADPATPHPPGPVGTLILTAKVLAAAGALFGTLWLLDSFVAP